MSHVHVKIQQIIISQAFKIIIRDKEQERFWEKEQERFPKTLTSCSSEQIFHPD